MQMSSNYIGDPDNEQIVIWSDMYNTGITQIDEQHKELVTLINVLFQACLHGKADAAFKEAMGKMVEYVNFHFSQELMLLERISYPMYSEHKQQHDVLVLEILDAVKEFKEGKKYTPNNFVRTLKEWVLSHIAIADQIYATFIMEQKKKGFLADLI